MTLRDQFSAQVHEQWSNWMKYLFSKSNKNDSGEVVIPKELVERWERQMNTPYDKLSAEEQASDQKEADKFLGYLKISNANMTITRTPRR